MAAQTALEFLEMVHLKGQRKECFQMRQKFNISIFEEQRRMYNRLLLKYYDLHFNYIELADSELISIYGLSEILNFFNYSIQLPKPRTPKILNPQNPQNVLTYTTYYYGMITLSTKTNNNYTAVDKQTRQEGIDYLTNCYNRYFADAQNIKTKDFDCNFWIEEIVSSSYIHAHIFYRRKKGYLFAGKNWLKQNSTFTCNIQNQPARTDQHIRNMFNYKYDDKDSILVMEFPKQFNELE